MRHVKNVGKPQLAIVVHTEEEFNWSGGVYAEQNKVTHTEELKELSYQLLKLGAKITFCCDYAFINSESGKEFVEHFKTCQGGSIEFGTHLHPWVNPPIEQEHGEIPEFDSYPGNLPKELEFEKLKVLTELIAKKVGNKPTTYLAGRYGIGPHSHELLKKLDYSIDVSVTPFTDYTHQQGPDFKFLNNEIKTHSGLLHWPHSAAIIAPLLFIARFFDQRPHLFEAMLKHPIGRLLLKFSRIKRQRLSPEGFSLAEMKRLTRQQIKLGQQHFILSYHSPSAKQGMTPYVNCEKDKKRFDATLLNYVKWFKEECQGTMICVQNLAKERFE